LCSLRDAPNDRAALLDYLIELSAVGVTWVAVNGEGASMPEALDWIGVFGANVIAPLRR
jgi:hypothetical protein